MADLEEEVAALRREIRALRTGQLVARLTEAEKDEIAAAVAQRLEPLLASLRRGAVEKAPKTSKKQKRGLFGRDD